MTLSCRNVLRWCARPGRAAMLVTAAAPALSACGGADKKDKPASRVAAKVIMPIGW